MICEQVRGLLLESLGEPETPLPADVRSHLDECAACREELAEMRDTWAMLGRLEDVAPGERMRARFHAMLARESAGLREGSAATARPRLPGGLFAWRAFHPALQAGLLAAMLIVGLALGTWIGSRRGGRAEIDDLRAEMRSMSRAVTLSLLMHQSASERLRGVGLCEGAPLDDELLQALMRAVEDDPSANVRLAALEVLGSLPPRPDVRDALLASFPNQASPPVRAAMASLLLELDGQKAVDAVRAAATDDRLPGSVRQYLRKILAEKGGRTGTGT